MPHGPPRISLGAPPVSLEIRKTAQERLLKAFCGNYLTQDQAESGLLDMARVKSPNPEPSTPLEKLDLLAFVAYTWTVHLHGAMS